MRASPRTTVTPRASAPGRPAAATRTAAGPGGPDGRRGPRTGVLLTVLSVCTGITAANIYLATPLLGLIAGSFGVAPSAVGWIASLAQLGYAVGLLFFAPLGDTADRRRLVWVLSALAAVALAVAACAPGPVPLAAAVLVACAATVVPQLLIPLVAERAPAGRRGRHVGAVVTGMFAGSVAARVLGGLAGQAYGWRPVFLGAAALTLAIGVLTAAVLPPETRPVRRSHPLRAIAGLPRLVASSPGLRAACARQAGLFGTWSALWTTLVLLLTSDGAYGMTTAAAGLFGLFGLVSALASPATGTLIDRFGAHRVMASGYALAVVSLPLFWLGGHRLWALCAGAVILHAGFTAGQVANQTRALASSASPAAANTAYVVSCFAAGAITSALAGPAFGHWGWNGVCAIAAGCAALGWAGGALAARER
ncbi:MFS transporter [Streptomyces luteireticuli]|uniref:MFS transporter n=1 Tax=Streptomyces luteireticuli TaxID=173858 RepID=A0ABP3I0M3_9ACTN